MKGEVAGKLERLAPLIGVFLFVFGSTAVISFARQEYAFMSVGQTFMAMFFLTFGGFKAYNLDGFVEAFQEYDFLAARSSLYATTYPFLELGLGVSYLVVLFQGFPGLEIFTYVLTVFLMGASGTGVLNALARGRNLQCACLGNVFNVPMTTVTLIENLGMSVMALVMLVSVI